ncbi:MAG: FtsQ-type POTRA domain-containing protein [Streptococcaceae bacterium]|jgi:cell division protein FtsQ|nr:FtsQ-type POTRA domain-containing protein [Streptococcaceae bacterium]
MSNDHEENLTPWKKTNDDYLKRIEDEQKQAEEQIEAEAQIEVVAGGVDKDGDPILRNHKPRVQHEIPQKQVMEEQEVEYESFSEALPKLKKQKNKVMVRRLILIVSVAFVFILGLLYIISPFSKLNTVEVTGAGELKTEDILKASGLKKGQPLFPQVLSLNKFAEKVEKSNPRIKKAEVKFHLMNMCTINIERYKVLAYEEVNKSYHPVLENGVLLEDETVKKVDKKYLIFENFNGDKRDMEALVKGYNQLDVTLRNKIKKATSTPTKANPQLVTFDMKDGNKVIISIQEIKEKFPYYPQVAKSMKAKGYVDMEVGIYSYSYATWERLQEEEKERQKEAAEKKARLEEEKKKEVDEDETSTENE